jgi:cell division septal protein FtsQ
MRESNLNWRWSLSRRSKRYVRNKKRKKGGINKRRVFLVLFLVAALCLCITAFKKYRVGEKGFYVKNINISGTERVKSDYILAGAGIEKNSIIKQAKKEEIEQKLKCNIWVEDVSLKEGLFGRLSVVVKEREPVAIVRGGKKGLLCSDGKIIPYVQGVDNLPNIYIDTGGNLLTYAVRLKKLGEIFNSDTLTIHFRNEEEAVVEFEGLKIIVGDNILFPSEQGLIPVFEQMKGEGYTVCDMRFRNQIIFEKRW